MIHTYVCSFFLLFLIVSVDCELSDWSSCSATCGGGSQNRFITVEAKFGGKDCIGKQEKKCKLRECPGESLSNY